MLSCSSFIFLDDGNFLQTNHETETDKDDDSDAEVEAESDYGRVDGVDDIDYCRICGAGGGDSVGGVGGSGGVGYDVVEEGGDCEIDTDDEDNDSKEKYCLQ